VNSEKKKAKKVSFQLGVMEVLKWGEEGLRRRKRMGATKRAELCNRRLKGVNQGKKAAYKGKRANMGR